MRTVYHGLYRLGLTPWDTAAIPAPLADAVEGPAALPPGRALDLGCGTGHQARYLAAHGWTVTAVDIVGRALSAASDRDSSAPQRRLIDWRLADVTRLREVDPDDRLAATMTLLLDNGCLHGIPDTHRPGWAATVQALAAPGCVLLIRAATRRYRGIGPAGLAADELPALLGSRWHPTSATARGWHRYVHAER